MKKIGISLAAIFFFGAILTSCKSHGPNCAAYSTKADAPKVKHVEQI